jgi:hypothetical protein
MGIPETNLTDDVGMAALVTDRPPGGGREWTEDDLDDELRRAESSSRR